MEQSEISAGVAVTRRSDPQRLGVLTGRTQALGPRVMAQVNWGLQREFVDIGQLCPAPDGAAADMDTLVARGRYGTLEHLRRRITYEKLQGTLTDVFYSMATSVIRFYPHQFKPVLRFIESPTNRLLVADEVGLGKTIEAGLAWIEWQARTQARRLLVVCPSSLVPKWERELFERFSLPVQVADAATLLSLLRRYQSVRDQLSFVAVCSYDALAPRKRQRTADGTVINEKELLDLLRDPPRYGRAPPEESIREQLTPRAQFLYSLLEDDGSTGFLNMAVFDEAHRMKNTGTVYHTLGGVLSTVAGATLCLSATPLHNRSRDLFALLSLVDPDYFRDEHAFDALVADNRPIVELLNAVSSPGPEKATLQELAARIQALPAYADSRLAEKVVEMAARYDGTPAAAVALFREAEKLNLLGSYLNRTRKVQVIENRVIRKPVTLSVRLSPEETAFHAAVLAHVRKTLEARGTGATVFHLIHPALRMASCMPVMKQLLDQGRWGGWEDEEEEIAELAADLGDDAFDGNGNGGGRGGTAPEGAPCVEQFREYDFEANDSKYAALRRELFQRIPHEKVLVFAFFKDTVRYLQRRLRADGIPCLAVTGDIADRAERDALMQRFETDDNRVLLLSEIGAEGVDLQFCRTMVNYDLPWNPMRVEQRIGRIDRLGQEAASVTIVNLHTPGTIDGRIFELLYERIGIFRSTIGDLEGILGEQVAKLTMELLRRDLTPEQQALRIEATARAVLERREAEAELEQSSSALVAFTDYLAESIGESQRLGRFIRPEELRVYVEDFLAARHPGAAFDWDTPREGCARVRLPFEAVDALKAFARQRNDPLPSALAAPGNPVTITFDPQVHEKTRRQVPSLMLVNHLHPLIRWITNQNRLEERCLVGVCAVAVRSTQIGAGDWFFLVRRLSLQGLRRRESLLFGLRNLATGELVSGPAAEQLLNDCLISGESRFPGAAPGRSDLLDGLRRELGAFCARQIDDFTDEMRSKAAVQRDQVTAHFGRRLTVAEGRLLRMRLAPERKDKGLALARRQVESLQHQRDEALRRLSDADAVKVSMDDVCCGLLQVQPAAPA